MAKKLDPNALVDFTELLMANTIQVDALCRLLIEKGIFFRPGCGYANFQQGSSSLSGCLKIHTIPIMLFSTWAGQCHLPPFNGLGYHEAAGVFSRRKKVRGIMTMAKKNRQTRISNRGAQRSRWTRQQLKRSGRIKMEPGKLGYHSNKKSDLPAEQFEVTITNEKGSTGKIREANSSSDQFLIVQRLSDGLSQHIHNDGLQ